MEDTSSEGGHKSCLFHLVWPQWMGSFRVLDRPCSCSKAEYKPKVWLPCPLNFSSSAPMHIIAVWDCLLIHLYSGYGLVSQPSVVFLL